MQRIRRPAASTGNRHAIPITSAATADPPCHGDRALRRTAIARLAASNPGEIGAVRRGKIVRRASFSREKQAIVYGRRKQRATVRGRRKTIIVALARKLLVALW